MNRLWHATIASLATFALVAQICITINEDRSVVNYLSYFTVQSNLLVAIACWLLVVRQDRQEPWYQALRLASLVGITVTGIIFATVLAGDVELTGLSWWLDKIFHYVVPAMSVIGFVAFSGRTRLTSAAWWFLVWPIAWLGYTLLRAEVAEPVFEVGEGLTSAVPYTFLDAAENGAVSVAVVSLMITVMAVAIAAGYIRISRRTPQKAGV